MIPIGELIQAMTDTVHCDSHHHGETVLEHTQEVVEDVAEAFPLDQTLRLVAEWHDVGKPEAARKTDEGSICFTGHAAISARIAREHSVDPEAVLLIEAHHDLLSLANNLKSMANNQPGRRVDPFDRFAESPVVEAGLLDRLEAFTRLDSKRNLDAAETSALLDEIVPRVRAARAALVAKRARAARIAESEKNRVEEARAFLEASGAPAAAAALPDFKAARAALGKAKAFELIKRLEAFLAGE